MALTVADLQMFRIYKMYQAKDLPSSLGEYHALVDALTYLNETLADQKIEFPHWWTYSDTIVIKFILHSHTIYTIASGNNIQSKYIEELSRTKIIDISSLKIILRAQLEAFLMYHHIYVNPSLDEEKEFRFNAWMYTSLIERQQFPSDSEIARTQLKKDAIELQKLEQQLKASTYFDTLSPNQQNTFLRKGSARMYKSWKAILEESGFSNEHLLTTFYSIMSNYAHSEALSILQIKQSSLSYNESSTQANFSIFTSKQLVCLMISKLISSHKVVEERFLTLPEELRGIITGYAMIAKHYPRKKNRSADPS
jgi:hypothetical protein